MKKLRLQATREWFDKLASYRENYFPELKVESSRSKLVNGVAASYYGVSNDKGGTWSGVIDGLRKNRKIFVMKPEANEKNANNLLIEKGAIPVDFYGKLIENYQVDPHPVSNAPVNEAPDEADKKSKRRKSKSDPQQGELFGE